jgi:prevent-host-death family protein
MKTVSATEAKSRFGSLLAEVSDGTDAILIENHGNPRAVLVSAQEWITLNDARERVRRLEAWESLRQLAAEVSARNADLTQEEADALADEIAEEAMARVVAKARQRWEERSR